MVCRRVVRSVGRSFSLVPLVVLAVPLWADPQPAGPLPRNFGEVTTWLYRGGQPSAGEIRQLSRMGIRTIVDLRKGIRSQKRRLAEELGMEYVAIPMSARRPVSGADVEALLRVLDDPGKRPVFVHCLAGKHRTGVMIALYRVLREGMSADDAYAEMERYHFGGRFPPLRDYVYETAASLARPAAGKDDAAATGVAQGAPAGGLTPTAP